MINALLIDPVATLQLLIGFGINALVIIIIVRYLYYPTARRNDYLFTYVLVSFTVFLLCFMLASVKLELGLALGLFAIFGILRYRTASMPIKEMTYLFVVIAISVINALTTGYISYSEVFVANVLIVGTVYGLERIWQLKNELCMNIDYEKMDLIRPEFVGLLKNDLEKRTGLVINKIQIGNIDFQKAIVAVKIFYYENRNTSKVKSESKKEIRGFEFAGAWSGKDVLPRLCNSPDLFPRNSFGAGRRK